MKMPKIFLIFVTSLTLVLNPMITMAAISEEDAQLQPVVTISSNKENTEEKAASTEQEEKENTVIKSKKIH